RARRAGEAGRAVAGGPAVPDVRGGPGPPRTPRRGRPVGGRAGGSALVGSHLDPARREPAAGGGEVTRPAAAHEPLRARPPVVAAEGDGSQGVPARVPGARPRGA